MRFFFTSASILLFFVLAVALLLVAMLLHHWGTYQWLFSLRGEVVYVCAALFIGLGMIGYSDAMKSARFCMRSQVTV